MADLIAVLHKEGISTVVRGSDLGRQYSAKARQERCGQNVETTQKANYANVEIKHQLLLLQTLNQLRNQVL